MNHLVLDLEMCTVPRMYRSGTYNYSTEIIQIGAVLLDEKFEQIDTFNQYVHPVHGCLDYNITNLTGITNADIKNAPVLKDALFHMLEWIGDREYLVYAWSDTDYKQLAKEILAKSIEDASVDSFMNEERWIDYQVVFGERFGYDRSIGLNEALLLLGIEAEGRLHDGCDDAINTAKIIRKMELEDDLKLIVEEQEEQEAEPLSFGLSGLFAGIKLE